MLTINIFDDETGLLQPELTVYIMFVVPAVKVVTNPAPFTVATEVLLLLQTPAASPSVV